MPARIKVACLTATLVAALSTSQSAQGSAVDFSPDGRQIAYEWSRGLNISPVEGGGPASVDAADKVQFVRWSPNGRVMALLNRTEAGNDLSIYNPVTGKARGLGGGFSLPFAWREDSNRFACVSQTNEGRREMVWCNVVENGVSFRAPLGVAPDQSLPMVWLPATDDVAFVGTDRNVYTMESGELKRVTNSSDVIGLALYAGGKKLVWARRSPNLRYILLSAYAYDMTSRGVVRLPFPERVSALNPNPRTAPESVDRVDFSPYGQHMLLFARQTAAAVLYSVDMGGRTARQIQRIPIPPGSTQFDPWTVVDTSSKKDGIEATWSRDGKLIAVRATVAGKQKLFTTAADGTGPRPIRSE